MSGTEETETESTAARAAVAESDVTGSIEPTEISATTPPQSGSRSSEEMTTDRSAVDMELCGEEKDEDSEVNIIVTSSGLSPEEVCIGILNREPMSFYHHNSSAYDSCDLAFAACLFP